MKQNEISYVQALKVLKRGKAVKCQHGIRDDQYEIVHTTAQLEYLYGLSKSGVQMCKIYPIQESQIKLSEDNVEISFDEAYEMINSGELVYYKEDEEEDEITTVSQLIELRRTSQSRGEKLCLYWHE